MSHLYTMRTQRHQNDHEYLGFFAYESWAKDAFLQAMSIRNDNAIYELIDESGKIIGRSKAVYRPCFI